MYRLENYTPELFLKWNLLVENSVNGTIFQRLDFLAYHGSRFISNTNHLVWFKGDHLAAVMPFGIFMENDRKVGRSPFGASWGGLVHNNNFSINDAIEIVKSLVGYLVENEIEECIITPTPAPYFSVYSNHFEFALFLEGFEIQNRILTSVLKIPPNTSDPLDLLTSKSRNAARKAMSQLNYMKDCPLEDFYNVMAEDKKRHHNAVPTHSFAELQTLHQMFPQKITFDLAVSNEGLKSGINYFWANASCVYTFYMAQENNALSLNGLNFLILKGIESAIRKNIGSIDFGPSLDKSEAANENFGVVRFKESCGGKGYYRDTFRWKKQDS
jgi:hypothetical protein